MAVITTDSPMAPSAHYFCKICYLARIYKVAGNWAGSAYRDVKYGVQRGHLILVSHHNVNDYCNAFVVTEPENGFIRPFNSPTVSGVDTMLKPKSGDMLCVYRNGHWVEEGPWKRAIVELLHDIETEVDEIRRKRNLRKEDERRKRQAAHDECVEKARKIFNGG